MQRFGSLIGFYADFVFSLVSIYMQGGSLAILNNTNVNSGTFFYENVEVVSVSGELSWSEDSGKW